MKNLALILSLVLITGTGVRIHSQSQPPENSGATLIQMKAANEAIIARQAATLEVLKAMEVDTNQLRIVAKRG